MLPRLIARSDAVAESPAETDPENEYKYEYRDAEYGVCNVLQPEDRVRTRQQK